MAAFLAYFDLLGYKKFIENNTEEQLEYRTDHFARNIERALALDHPEIASKRAGHVISDYGTPQSSYRRLVDFR